SVPLDRLRYVDLPQRQQPLVLRIELLVPVKHQAHELLAVDQPQVRLAVGEVPRLRREVPQRYEKTELRGSDVAVKRLHLRRPDTAFGGLHLYLDDRRLEPELVAVRQDVDTTVRARRGDARPIPQYLEQVGHERRERVPLEFARDRL